MYSRSLLESINIRLPIICLIVLCLIEVHDIGPQLKNLSHIDHVRPILCLSVYFENEVVIHAALFWLSNNDLVCIEIKYNRDQLLGLQTKRGEVGCKLYPIVYSINLDVREQVVGVAHRGRTGTVKACIPWYFKFKLARECNPVSNVVGP